MIGRAKDSVRKIPEGKPRCLERSDNGNSSTMTKPLRFLWHRLWLVFHPTKRRVALACISVGIGLAAAVIFGYFVTLDRRTAAIVVLLVAGAELLKGFRWALLLRASGLPITVRDGVISYRGAQLLLAVPGGPIVSVRLAGEHGTIRTAQAAASIIAERVPDIVEVECLQNDRVGACRRPGRVRAKHRSSGSGLGNNLILGAWRRVHLCRSECLQVRQTSQAKCGYPPPGSCLDKCASGQFHVELLTASNVLRRFLHLQQKRDGSPPELPSHSTYRCGCPGGFFGPWGSLITSTFNSSEKALPGFVSDSLSITCA
jgi:hypothetical protein